MKRVVFSLFIFLSFFMNSCEPPIIYKIITVRNVSSYDLRINFGFDDSLTSTSVYIGIDKSYTTNFKEIELKRNENTSFLLEGRGLLDPNDVVKIIYALNLDTNNVIEVDNNNKNLFIETYSNRTKTDYLLEINDDLLN